jgi:putative PIN family toxin of toxin-antitoxin system
VKVFLDTNVLVSAFATRGLCADLVRHLLTEHELVVGDVVLDELSQVMREKFGMPEEVLRPILDLLREQTVVPVPEKPVAVTVRDPDDVHVLASAQAAEVDVLVSGDGDLLDLADSVSLRIVDPRGMWNLLRKEEANP